MIKINLIYILEFLFEIKFKQNFRSEYSGKKRTNR